MLLGPGGMVATLPSRVRLMVIAWVGEGPRAATLPSPGLTLSMAAVAVRGVIPRLTRRMAVRRCLERVAGERVVERRGPGGTHLTAGHGLAMSSVAAGLVVSMTRPGRLAPAMPLGVATEGVAAELDLVRTTDLWEGLAAHREAEAEVAARLVVVVRVPTLAGLAGPAHVGSADFGHGDEL